MSIRRKKTVITLVLAVLFSIAVSAVSAKESQASDSTKAGTSAPTKLWVAPSTENNIPVQIDVFNMSKSGYSSVTYTCQLDLPGNVVLENCFLSWEG